MNSYKITTSGQVSLPAAVRKRWNTREVWVEDHGDHVVMRPVPDDPIEFLAGIWKGRAGPTTDEIRAEEREADALREERRYARA